MKGRVLKKVALHEMVHAWNLLIDPDMLHWLDNGVAGYLSKQVPQYPVYTCFQIPNFRQSRSDWPKLQFS
ncbi:MAG: hypothetical protein GX254_05945 [Clostridiales bacterium]|nr:hypothetical protein [Clostridiales bacterium]